MSLEELSLAFHDHRASDPNLCVALGIDRNLGALPDPSVANAETRRRSASQLARRFRSLRQERPTLSFEDQLDVELATLLLDAEAFDLTYEFNGNPTVVQQPRAGSHIGEGLLQLALADPRPSDERLLDITSRVEAIPRYVRSALAALHRPVERWVEMDLQKARELPTLLHSLLSMAEHDSFADVPRLAAATATACASMEAYCRTLEVMPRSQGFAIGPATAQRVFQLRGIELSLDELHGMACRFLDDTKRELRELAQRVAAEHGLPRDTNSDELQRFLNRRFRLEVPTGDFERVLERYREEHQRIQDFLSMRPLFPIPTAQELRILETPSFMRPSIPAGAMTPPAPFREGLAQSLVFLTLSQSLLDEHTELSIPIMMIHEGIPGHHLQLATAARHPSIIRRHALANDQAEGWTTMLEDYMLDVGYVKQHVDEVRFCAKRELCRIGARVAIDLFFMTGERDFLGVGVDTSSTPLEGAVASPFSQARQLLQAVTGFTKERAEAELNWYSQERAYPSSYLIGNQLTKALRRDVATALPEATSEEADHRFFSEFLSSGNMPLSFLRRRFEHLGLVPSATA